MWQILCSFLQVLFSLALLYLQATASMRTQRLPFATQKTSWRPNIPYQHHCACSPSQPGSSQCGRQGFCILYSGPQTVSRHPVHPPAPHKLSTRHTVGVKYLSQPLKACKCMRVEVTSTPLSFTLHSASQHTTYFLPCGRLLIISPTRA